MSRASLGTVRVQIRIRTAGTSPWKRSRFIETQCFESSKPRYIIALQQVAMYLLVADDAFSLSPRSISAPLAGWIRSFRNRRKAVPPLRSRTGGASGRASIWRAAAPQSEQMEGDGDDRSTEGFEQGAPADAGRSEARLEHGGHRVPRAVKVRP